MVKHPLIILGSGTVIQLQDKEPKVDDRTIDILKLHQAISENKKIKIRYTSYSDGTINFYTYNHYQDGEKNDTVASYNVSGSMYHLSFIVKPVRLTKKYIVVDPKQTKLLIPTEVVRAFTLKRILEHPRVDYFQGSKQKFYIDYVSEIETV